MVDATLGCAARGSPRHANALARALKATDAGPGEFLVGVECLLSTHADELGMLEDMLVALEWLSSCRVRFVNRTGPRWTATRKDGHLIAERTTGTISTVQLRLRS